MFKVTINMRVIRERKGNVKGAKKACIQKKGESGDGYDELLTPNMIVTSFETTAVLIDVIFD